MTTHWSEYVPGGTHWSGTLPRGALLRLTDPEGRANAAVLMFRQSDPSERYNMADTLKAQHTAYLTRGHVLYSDMGRILCSVVGDTCGWHDVLCGVSNAALVRERYGEARYQAVRNDFRQNGQDSLLVELGKYGLGRRDLVANVNFFSKVRVDDAGGLDFVAESSYAGATVDLRFEMDVLLILATAPHPLDTSPVWRPGAVRLDASRAPPVGADDICRLHCPENGRGFTNTERLYL